MAGYVIDAKSKRLGRLATEIAVILQGKQTPHYDGRLPGTDTVTVKNVKGLTVSGKKRLNKVYYRQTGPLGHLKTRKFKDVMERNPAFILRHAVYLMLPKNRLRKVRMKRLIVE